MVHEGPSYTPKNCPLCKMAKLTEWKIVVCKCLRHPDCWMIVWGEHTRDPGPKVKKKLREIMESLFPGIKLRGPGSIPEHFHFHQKGVCEKRKREI